MRPGRARARRAHGLVLALALATGFTLPSPAVARTVEEVFDLPLQVDDAYGKPVARAIKVTVFRDDAASAPRPLLVLNHGRPGSATERAGFGRARFAEHARWFVAQGFVVALPTRIGYGVTGGEDLEDTGGCANRRFAPGFEAAVQQTLAVLAAMRQRTDQVGPRALLVGQSFGGMTAVATAAQAPPGVVAAINFAGGSGGDPVARPGRPCSTAGMEQLAAQYGARSTLPTLWVYAENDKYFGPTHPREWAAAYRAAGGAAEFVQFPAAGDDGHRLFADFPAVWHPVVVDFLRRQGFAMAGAAP